MSDMKSLLPKGRTLWMMIGGVLGLLLVLGGIGLGPVRSKFRTLDEAISLQEKTLARNLRILAPVPRRAVESEYQQFGVMLEKKGSSEEENSLMLAELDRLAGQSKVTLLATKPQKPSVDRDFETYGVEIEAEAEMPALMSFMHGIESSAQLLRIDRLVIDSKGGGATVVKGAFSISKIVAL